MLNTGLAPWPFYANDEINAVTQCLISGQVNQWTGNEVKEFEKEFAAYVGTKYAVAVSNGTTALDLIFQNRNLFIPGEEVIVTSRTFLASVSSIVNAGLVPVFVDVDRDSGNVSVDAIKSKVNIYTTAILCVHLAGWPCDMDEINAIANEHKLLVIEDCAQAHGAEYNGRKVGSLGDVAAWSFCQDKIMSTGGEGGMITTNNKSIFRRAWEFKDHGKNWDKVQPDFPHAPGFRWLHDSFGSNYRMTEMAAAIGRIQLKKLDKWVDHRNSLASKIDQAAEGYSAVRVVRAPDHIKHAKYKHYIYVNPEGLNEGWNRDRIICELNAEGVPCYSGSCSEVYLEKAFEGSYSRPAERLPVAKELGETSLMFLVHPTIGGRDMYDIVSGLERVLLKASKYNEKCKM